MYHPVKYSEVNLWMFLREYNATINEEDRATIAEALSTVLPLSVLGARVCYSKDVIAEIEQGDPRFYEDMTDYLGRIYEMGHLSVFAHTPVIIPVHVQTWFSYGMYNLFKALFLHHPLGSGPMQDYGLLHITFRHIVEGAYKLSVPFRDVLYLLTGRRSIEGNDRIWQSKRMWTNGSESVYRWGTNITTVDGVPDSTWYVVLWDNVSRVTTHQFVRHQALNFNQQSQRYAGLRHTAPPRMVYEYWKETYGDDKANDLVKPIADSMLWSIQRQQEKAYRKEDVRFASPMAVTSAIVASGWQWDWMMFLETRTQQAAQYEIRRFAQVTLDLIQQDLQEEEPNDDQTSHD